MQHKTPIFRIAIIIAIALFVMGGSYLQFIKMNIFKDEVNLLIDIKTRKPIDVTLYYTDGDSFSEDKTITLKTKNSAGFQKLNFALPNLPQLKNLRLDFSENAGKLEINNITLKGYGISYSYQNEKLYHLLQPINGINNYNKSNSTISFNTKGTDPYLHFTFNIDELYNTITNNHINILPFTPQTKITINTNVERTRNMSIYYSSDENFNEQQKVEEVAYLKQEFHDVEFSLPRLKKLSRLRLDPTNGKFRVDITSIKFSSWFNEFQLNTNQLSTILKAKNDIEETNLKGDVLSITSSGNDPYLYFDTNVNFIYKKITQLPLKIIPLIFSIILSLLIGLWLINIKSNAFNINTNSTLINMFMVIISSPLLLMLFNTNTTSYVMENRSKTAFPKLEVEELFEYPKKFCQYYNDNVGFRDEILIGNSVIKTKLLGISPIPRKATLGQNDWLFLAEDTDPKYNNASHLFSNRELKTIQKNLEQRAQFLNKQNIPFYFMVAPSKSSIYPEHLPKNLKNRTPSRLKQLFDYLNKNSFVKIIDARKELLEAKKHTQVYYKGDSHWNEKGAFVTYKKLITTIQKDFPTIDPLKEDEFNFISMTTFDGDLSKFLLLQNDWPLQKSYLEFLGKRKKKNVTNKTITKNKNGRKQVVRITRESDQPKILIYRDSYANHIAPYLSGHFSSLLYLWDYQINPATIEQEKPDLVVLEMYERSLEALLIPNSFSTDNQNN